MSFKYCNLKESCVNLLIMLLRNNGIRVNKLKLEFQLLSHPSYPSLNSITGVLDRFAIENYALDIPKGMNLLNPLPNYFLTVVKRQRT